MVKPIIIETQRFEDFRGWLSVSAEGFHVVQIKQGFSKKAGTLRGLHFQEGEHAQAKLVSCLHGLIFNVAVDLRLGGTYTSIQLSLSKAMQFYNKKCSISNKNALFPTPSLKITSGEILAKEAAEERIWAGRTLPADAPGPRTLRGMHAISHEKCIRIKRTRMQKHPKIKIAKKLENNAETWYNLGTNKPVLVRQRDAVVL